MTFLHATLAAAGFACVAIPIIIHFLFRNRRRPIRWAAMRFLLEALRKQRRRLRLEQILLLATRCLLLAALAAALGRPLLEGAGIIGASRGRTVYFVIDNSLTSTARDESSGKPALDRLKELAQRHIAALAPGDRAGLVTLAAPSEPLIVPASADLRAVAGVLEAVTPADARADFAGALESIAARLRADQEARSAAQSTQIVLLSDFRRGSLDLSRALPAAFAGIDDVTITATEPTQQVGRNIQITGVEPLHALVLTGSAGNAQDAPVRVSLRRSGNADAGAEVTTLRLGLADTQQRFRRPPVSTGVRWAPGQTEATVTVQLNTDPGQAVEPGAPSAPQAGPSGVLVAELDRDALEADNTFRRPMNVRDAVQVGIVAQRQFGRTAGRVDRLGAAEWLRLALRPTDVAPMEIVDIEPSSVDAAVLAPLDAVFVPNPDMVPVEAWPRLRQFVDNAGLLVVMPSADAAVHLWTDNFTKAMNLDWRIAREPENSPEEPWGLNPEVKPSALFALLEPELQPLLKPVSINRVLGFQETPDGADSLLTLRDGRPWLVAASPSTEGNAASRGLVVYLASAPVLSWTDLPARPLMVPLIQEIVKQGVGRAAGASTAIAGEPALAPASPSGVAELRRVGDEQARIEVGPGGLSRSAIRTAGVYAAIDQAGRNVGTLAVNADADAGLVESQDPESVRAWLAGAWGSKTAAAPAPITFFGPQQPAQPISAADAGASISFPLLIAALALALAETAMARWFSHARREQSPTVVGLTAA